MPILGENQSVSIVSEAGMYKSVMSLSSRMQQAHLAVSRIVKRVYVQHTPLVETSL